MLLLINKLITSREGGVEIKTMVTCWWKTDMMDRLIDNEYTNEATLWLRCGSTCVDKIPLF